MSRQSLQPADLFTSTDFGYAQVVTTEDKKIIFCAGLTACDKDLKLIGGDDPGPLNTRQI